ncbi:MAG: hypothetical protein IJF76_04385 [Clostridia bacterium]|nr:hypothetical protein [Clostridia bacterium]
MKSKTKIRSFKFIVFFLFFVLLISSAILPRAGASFALADSEITTDDFAYDESAETLEEFKDIKSLSFIRFYEYGFSDSSQFELHFYLYNPERTNYIDDSRNKAQIGFSDNDKDVFRVTYNKYTLAFAGKSESGLFLKYKITGFNMPTSETRYYCFSGVELVKEGATNATEYGVSRIFKCVTKDNVTTISTDDLPTCEVDVTHTFWRSDYSSKGDGWSNQISSCYFALPETYSGDSSYGRLSGLTAEFWNYFTNWMFIFEDKEYYDIFKKYVNVSIADIDKSEVRLEVYSNMLSADWDVGSIHFEYGGTNRDAFFFPRTYDHPILSYGWVFLDEDAEYSKDYRFDGDNIEKYYYDYVTKYGKDKAIEDLFLSEDAYTIDKYSLCNFNYGYNKHTYTISNSVAGDIEGFEFQYAGDTNWWQRLWGKENPQVSSIVPLVQVNGDDITLTDEEFSEKYYIDVGEVPNLKKYYETESKEGRDVWILRYDACEYYGNSGLYRVDIGDEKNGFIAREAVYLDFDILEFFFEQNGEVYTVAAVTSPHNVFNDITPSPQPEPEKEPGFWDRFVDFLREIGAWAIVVIGGAVGVTVLFFMIKLLKKTWQSDTALIWKILLTLICIGLCVIVGIYVVPWVIDVVNNLGGLRLKE